MAITTTEELVSKCLELIPRGNKPYRSAVQEIIQGLKDGGSVLTLEEISTVLREAYVDGWLTEPYLRDLIAIHGCSYEK